MSSPAHGLAGDFDLEGARSALLRYQPASHWLSSSRDPTPRMTVGFGFDVSRPEAPEMLRQVGLDPADVRSGSVPITDAQMHELFDLVLAAAVEWAQRRLPGFAEMPSERQWTLLELIVWLGPDGMQAVLGELEQLSLPLTDAPLEPSRWFDEPAPSRRSSSGGAVAPAAPPVWSRTVFESFGLVAELVVDDPELLDAAQAMLPPGWRPVDDQPSVQFGLSSQGVITIDGVPVVWIAHREASLLRLGGVVRHHLATEAPIFTFVHAGVVEIDGCGIVIPGRSWSGKSTLVAELVRLGATYVSDEYAVLDPSGLVHPFAKPLSIRTGPEDPLGQLVHVPDELVAEQPVRAGLIVLTSYRPGADWNPTARSRAEGALALLHNTPSARMRPDATLSATSRVARGAVFLAGQRGEAAEAAQALLGAALLQSDGSTTFQV
jgi:hypothetical protein